MAGHVRQSVEDPPEHVAHPALQAAHVEAVAA